MTTFLLIIDGEQFTVDAPDRRSALEVAIAQATIMRYEGKLSDDPELAVYSMKEVKRLMIPVFFPKKLKRWEVLKRFEELHGAWRDEA